MKPKYLGTGFIGDTKGKTPRRLTITTAALTNQGFVADGSPLCDAFKIIKILISHRATPFFYTEKVSHRATPHRNFYTAWILHRTPN